MRAEFLLTATTRRRLAKARKDHQKKCDQISGMDNLVRLGQEIERGFLGLVKGPYGSRAISYGSNHLTINCSVMRMEDVVPILALLDREGWKALSSEDTSGYRQHHLSKDDLSIFLDCYPDTNKGSKCRLVRTGEMRGGYYPVKKYVCDPEEEEVSNG